VAQRVCRGIAVLLHDHGTRLDWEDSGTPRADFTAGKGPAPIVQEVLNVDSVSFGTSW